MSSLLAKLVSAVSPRTFYEQMLGYQLPSENTKGDVKIKCPFHEKNVGYEDATGSFSVNMRPENGGFYQCFGGTCGARGTMLKFFESMRGISDIRRLTTLLAEEFHIDFENFEGSIIDQQTLVKYQNQLHNTERGKVLLKHLREHRMISDQIIAQYRLGMSAEGRLAIPVLDADGAIVDVRGWLPEYARKTKADHNAKMISLTGTGHNKLFPYAMLRSPHMILAAGEMDTLALLSQGFFAITGTAGEGKFNKSWLRLFTEKDVTILQDADRAGDGATDELLRLLYKVTSQIKAVQFDLTDEIKDITDYIRNLGNDYAKAAVTALIANAPVFYIKDTQSPDHAKVTLYSAGTKENINRKISLVATVLGNETNDLGYYAIPRRITCECTAKTATKTCIGCPHNTNDSYPLEKLVGLDTADVVELLIAGNATPAQLMVFKRMFDVEGCRNARFKVADNDYEVVEPVLLIPDVDVSADSAKGTFFQRHAYHVGHGLRVNQKYLFRGRTVVDSKSHVTHVFDYSEPKDKKAADLGTNVLVTIDGVEASVGEFLHAFKAHPAQHPNEKLREIYEDLRIHVTKVVGRDDICQAYDLVYHSPISFNFGDRYLHHGWMSAFIFGDTQCGKTETFIRLRDHYRLGKLYNGESISRAGIIGAYVEAPGRRGLTFRAGVGPTNDEELFAIDEFTGLKDHEIGELTHMRSSGKAQSTKVGMDNSLDARVRMIAIANPRDHREMATFNPGCHAVKQIIGEDADVARFDIFIAVSREEVALDDIHAQFPVTSAQKYSSDLCNLLLQWVWTRHPSDYEFTEEAQKYVRDKATEMGNQYDAAIPIIAPGSHHWTIARVAASIAARLYSTSEDGYKVIIEREHVEAASDFLYSTYNKPAMGYNVYSAKGRREEKLASVEGLKKLLNVFPYTVVRALTNLSRFTRRELEDAANLESHEVRQLISQLELLNAIKQSKSWWYTTKAFKGFIQSGYVHPQESTFVEDAIATIDVTSPMYESPKRGSGAILDDD